MTEKATRRKFSAEYNLRILAEAEGSTERGQIGALLRREGLYASTLDKWRQQRARGTLGGEKRGPKVDAQAAELRQRRRSGPAGGDRPQAQATPRGLVAQLAAQESVSEACRLLAVSRG